MRSYKYRIYPSSKQITQLNQHFLLTQEMYNILLQRCKDEYKQNGKSISKAKLCVIIKEIKDNDCRFSTVFSQVFTDVADRIKKSYDNFFRRVKEKQQGKKVNVGFPRFKKTYKSITYTQFGFKFKNNRRLCVSKIGNIPILLHRPVEGKMKTMTIKRMCSGKWYVIFSCNVETEKIKHPSEKRVGIDVGLENFATLSNSKTIANPRYLIDSEKKLKKLQRNASRKKPGSKNRCKARIRVARMHEKIVNQRTDFLHKVSKELADRYGFIAVEKLNIVSMFRHHYLAKHISDASWYQFIKMISYKAESAGGCVVYVDAKGTSQICSGCGAVVSKSLAVRVHKCHQCGLVLHRDVNSALNILDRATVGLTGSYACG